MVTAVSQGPVRGLQCIPVFPLPGDADYVGQRLRLLLPVCRKQGSCKTCPSPRPHDQKVAKGRQSLG